MTPYLFRQAVAGIRAMRLPTTHRQGDLHMELAGYCLDAVDCFPAGSHEPGPTPRTRALSTLASRDL
jgi:hypothetical protein